MILKAFLFILSCLIIVSSFPDKGMAAKLCDMAEDTAGLQNCLRNRLNVAQKNLNKAFTQLEKEIEGEKKEQLKELQKTWLDYRDQECMWEAEQASNDSLKIINELSCMAVVTENRANLLESAYSDYDTAAPREFSNTPRWINVLNKDLPQYDWDIDDVFLSDLNCDDRNEVIASGEAYKVTAVETQTEDEPSLRTHYQKNIAIAVIDNLEIGRPSVNHFVFPVHVKSGEESLCNKDLKFDVIEEKQSDEQGQEEPNTCLKKLKISQSQCADHFIVNDKNGFILEEKISEEKSE